MAKKSKKPVHLPEPNLPPYHPDAVAKMADAMDWKTAVRDFPLEDYIEAIRKLHARGYSYAHMAAFLNEKLAAVLGHKKITRGQVYRVYQQWLEQQDPLSAVLNATPISDISPEDAEAKAELSDKKSKPTEEKSP